ncbi:RNA polymerase sigma factor [Streptosporangium sp. NPDC050855]|uniref:RNA polymerase sigma factor n=1 Tax=Streptosporangium sp. NPDC050855 TaxID=3366194 RepID=UPI0037BDC476
MDDNHHIRFEKVYLDTYEQILGYAIRRCDCAQDAADVVAETFEIAWRRIEDLPAGGEARLWLYGVARNVLAGHRRGRLRHRSRHTTLDEDVVAFYARTAPSDERLEFTQVADVFRGLSDDDRELLSLVAWEGLDAAEIARVLGCSRNAVRIRLHRARKRFAHRLAAADLTFTPMTRTAQIPAGRPL